jgi:hypothetical protein
MGLLDGIGGLGGLLDPGALVHQVVDSVLPQNMQWLGGAVGAFVDFECGNQPGALTQGMSALHDLADVAQNPGTNKPTSGAASAPSSKPAAGGSSATTSFEQEPSPPASLNPLQLAMNPLALLQEILGGLGRSPAPSTTTQGGWQKTPPPPPPKPQAAAAPSTAPSGATSSAAPSAKPSGQAPDPSTLSKDAFLSLSDDDLVNAVRDGKVPQEVTDSQAGMLALQTRLDHISEMNQMMTTMMQSIHQMKMSVIANIKV